MAVSALEGLIGRIQSHVGRTDCSRTRCKGIEEALVAAAEAAGPELLPSALREPRPDGYARHLVHRDPDGRFSMIAMVWGSGQGTPIHDHGGLWCVECVVQGCIQVRTFRQVDSAPDDRLGFRCAEVLKADRGEAGHLIPPLDHHVIENPFEDVAVTLHVYGGDMDWCNAYRPHPDGGYVEVRKELSLQ